MKIELKSVEIPTPPKDVVITLSQEEAIKLAAIVGQVVGGVDGVGDCRKFRQFTGSMFYSLYDNLFLGSKNYKEYELVCKLIKKPLELVQ